MTVSPSVSTRNEFNKELEVKYPPLFRPTDKLQENILVFPQCLPLNKEHNFIPSTLALRGFCPDEMKSTGKCL